MAVAGKQLGTYLRYLLVWQVEWFLVFGHFSAAISSIKKLKNCRLPLRTWRPGYHVITTNLDRETPIG